MSTAKTINLTKSFAGQPVLNDLNLELNEPSVVGLIGLNGSGKTTLLRHFTGLNVPTTGEVYTFDTPARNLTQKQLARIGFVSQQTNFLEWMTVKQQLDYIGRFYAAWDKDMQARFTHEFDLDPKSRVGTLSPGNAQKLAVIAATCHHPEFLILDEPASSMDPLARRKLLQLLFEVIAGEFRTVVVSSHVLTDIERVVNQVICLHQGRLVADCELDDLYDRFAVWSLTREPTDANALSEPYIKLVERLGKGVKLHVEAGEAERIRFQRKYATEVQSHRLNLDEIFPLLIGDRKP